MDNKYTCPMCGKKKFARTKKGKGDRIKCVSRGTTFKGTYCNWVSNVMTEEEMNTWLNYVLEPPTKTEQCIEELERLANSYDLDDDCFEEIKEIVLKYV